MRVDIFLAFSAFSIAYALWKGGKPEAVVALMLLAALVASLTLVAVPNFAGVSVWLAVVDAALMLGLVALAMFANRLWPIALSACQVASVMGHVTKLVAPGLVPLGYAFLIAFWAWPMTAILIFGTWCHQQRMRAGYSDRPWKSFSRSTKQASRT